MARARRSSAAPRIGPGANGRGGRAETSPAREVAELTAAGAMRQPVLPLGDGVAGLLTRLRASAFQGRALGEAFAIWQEMLDGPGLVCLGLAGSLASAGLGPLLVWLVERGYVDVIAATSANVTEDLLELRGARVTQVDPGRVDDAALGRAGLYRFYDHVVSARAYDAMEDFTASFFEHLAATWAGPSISGIAFMREFGRWLEGEGCGASLAATCARRGVPLFVPAAPDGPLAEGYRAARDKGPVVDFFADYTLALELLDAWMVPGRGTGVIYLGGGVPKDFLQIVATSVAAVRGDGPTPHGAAIQITTDHAVFGGLGGAGVGTEAVSWGKESVGGRNVMVHADVTLALPLLCEGFRERYGPRHVRRLAGREEVALVCARA